MKNILFIFTLFFLIILNCNNNYDFLININNETDKDISGLKISYENITKDIEIPIINTKSKMQIKIKPTENFGENTLILKYKDNDGNKHEEILIGYFEKGYNGKIDIKIKEIDENGIIKFEIKENINLY